ncbi:MAG: alpha/beta hydrolase [Bacteroidales bacterium]|nr:alpha/beta hydrolase [Bacteroidales bacterium]
MKQILIALLLGFSLTSLFAQNKPQVNILSDVVYHHKDGMALTMDIYIPKKQNGAGVIFINSGGFVSPYFTRQCKNEKNEAWGVGKSRWTFVLKSEIQPELFQQASFEELLNNGFTVFDVRHASAPKYLLDEIVGDLNLAIKYIKQEAENYRISKDRLGIWGGSAGAYLAAFLSLNPAENNTLKASVLYYPSGYQFLNSRNDLVRKMLPSLHISEQKLDSLSLKKYVSAKAPPTLIMYGELDQPFIKEPSEELFVDLQSKQVVCEKITFEKVGHIWMSAEGKYNKQVGDQAMKNLIDWFKKHL